MNVLNRNVFRRFGLLAVALVLAAGRPAPASAAAPVASLDIVPADAACYSVMLRNREQFDAIANSKAWAKIRDLPYVQMGYGLYQMQAANLDTPAGKFAAALNDPEARKSLDFLADMFSDEVFVYGGANFGKAIELFQTINGASTKSALTALMQNPGAASSTRKMDELRTKAFVQALVAERDLIAFPDLVIGFKVKDKDLGEKLLARLEPGLQQAFSLSPIFDGRFKRQTVAGHSYLTLSLDGGMIPWDEEVLDKIRGMAQSPEEGDKLIEHLKALKLVISLGMRDDFLLLAIGPSTDVLTKLGGPETLRSRPELAAVAKYADKRIASVNYTSKAFNQHFSPDSQIANLVATAKEFIPKVPGPEKLHEELDKTVDDLAADVKSSVTEIGATSSVGFLTDSGIESYSYDWTEHPEIDSSKPLSLLKHIGGNPIAVLVGRGKVSVADYDMLVKWLRVAYGYAEEYGVPQMPPKDQEQFHDAMAKIKPLVARLSTATRDLLLPALADGQSALVIDAKFTSRRFVKTMPPTENALPMLEPAVVVGVSDAAKLKEAFSEYYAVADDFLEVIKGIDKKDSKHDIPEDFKIPRPQVFNLRQGTIYGYALPAEWGVDPRVMPNAGLSEKVGVLALTRGHTQRLLTETENEPQIAGIKLSTDRPLGTVAAFDFAALIDAATPWVDLALDEVSKHAPPQDAEMAKLHTKTVLEVLKAYHGTVAETYVEDKVTVTHTRTEYHDIDE